MPKGIQNLILEMVQNCPRPVKSIASEVGKPYSTLMRELDPEDRGAKLGVEMLLPLMQACESVLPLRYLAARMGCRVAALENGAPGKASLHEELLDSYDAMTRYHRAIRDEEPLERVAELRERVMGQVQEDFLAYRRKKTGGEG